jgi:hypothetical protein
MTSPYENETSMPAESTRNMFVWVSGFGIGAMLVLFGFVFLIGIGQLGPGTTSGPSAATPAGQSASTAPTQPGPAPNPAPNTAAPAVPSSTTGQAPAPAQPETKQKADQAAPQRQPAR